MKLEQAYDFTGKVAIITGGSGVLCSRLALALGRQGAAAVVVGRSRLEKAQAIVGQIEADGGTALAFEADVLDRGSLEKLAETAVSRFGHVDILVNGAGGTTKAATTSKELAFFDLPEDAARWVFDVNFMGTFLACQVFGRLMVEQGRGTILNIGSFGGDRPLTRSSTYSAAKAAVMNFTRWLAVHMGQEYCPNIRVNALVPGFFLTEQNRFLLTEQDGRLTERGQRIIDHTPMARFGTPDDLVVPALMLLSDGAAFVHGTTLVVDGGISAFGGV
ncbi:MAG: SDR family oxidoreductase [Kiritimatiellae bacterium]|nr:SDR family oxidoreductase [Kiritimatiellia bacterium]